MKNHEKTMYKPLQAAQNRFFFGLRKPRVTRFFGFSKNGLELFGNTSSRNNCIWDSTFHKFMGRNFVSGLRTL